jgi:molybdate transport system substrate-binding protein
MSYRCVILMVAALLCCGLVGPAGAAEPASRPVTVFAAASLTNVLDELGKEFTRTTGIPVRFSFASSSILARQIESGAGADVFFSADQEWMDYLERRSRLQKSSRRNVAGNQLVLIAPRASGAQLVIEPGFPLLAALGRGRLATGDPDSVPVGRYARAALTSLGVWDEVADRLVRADDVRHALMFVARGEAPLGIVYATDARVDERVRIVGTFPADSHLPITYPVALTRRAGPDAERFVQFVVGDAGRAAFERSGFTIVP